VKSTEFLLESLGYLKLVELVYQLWLRVPVRPHVVATVESPPLTDWLLCCSIVVAVSPLVSHHGLCRSSCCCGTTA